jgi:hypothetical protein
MTWLTGSVRVRLCTAWAAALGILLLGAAPAWSAGEFEPNDDITLATVLAPGTYQAGNDTSTDPDWYAFDLAGRKQVSFSVQPSATSKCFNDLDNFRWSIRDYQGRQVREFNMFGAGDAAEYKYTTPPQGGRYYVVVGSSQYNHADCRYQLTVGPPDAGAPPPAPLPTVTVPEPNDTDDVAYGPLAADTLYEGVIETVNDSDRMFFYAYGSRLINVELTAVSGCGDVNAFISGASDEQATQVGYIASGERITYTFTTDPNTEAYGINVSEHQGNTGCRWQLRLSPAGAFAAAIESVPATASPACTAARRQRSRLANLVAQAKKRYARATTRTGRQKSRRTLAARRRDLAAAQRVVSRRCKT